MSGFHCLITNIMVKTPKIIYSIYTLLCHIVFFRNVAIHLLCYNIYIGYILQTDKMLSCQMYNIEVLQSRHRFEQLLMFHL